MTTHNMTVNYKIIGHRIREKRKELHMTQEDLSRETGFSSVTINRVENGKARAHLDIFISIANALNTTIDELLAGNLLNNTTSYQTDIDVLMHNCTPSERHYLYETVRNALLLLRDNEWELEPKKRDQLF